jgi:hypothetical protein
VQRNRQGQHRRDRQRHLQNLVKNNLAFSQVLILQTVPFSPAAPVDS